MKRFALAYLGALLALIVLDGLWLGVLMGSTYKALLGPLMLDQPRWLPALLFYLLYPLGVAYFAVLPALLSGRLGRALSSGALLGLIAYGTYDLSNWATLTGWPGSLVAMDMAWGVVISALSAAAGLLIARRATD
jgi:uncharacterized membrane protein